MGLHLSGVARCIFVEFLESGLFHSILFKQLTYLWYLTTEFTYKTEANNALHFLDIILYRADNDLKLSVHGKSINKFDLINF